MKLDFDSTRLPSPFYTEEHTQWREWTVRPFVDKEIIPYVDEWEEQGDLPDELWQKAAKAGLFQIGYPEKYGGVSEGVDIFHILITIEELARCGAGGVYASLMVQGIGLPPVVNFGSESMKKTVVPSVLNGTKHICLAITEPSGGSDVGNLKTTATRDGNHYIINGAKTFITGGLRANWFTTAVRTGGDGIDGISLILIPADAKGISRNSVGKKQGWLCSETASIYFDNVRVSTDQIIGAENKGFKPIVHNFNNERIGMVAACLGASRVCLEEAAQWAQDRKTFGKSLSKHQVIQHKFAEMLRKINATQAYMDVCGWHIKNGTPDAADIAMLKVQASQTMEFCAREAMQIMGGISYVRECRTERIYREVRVMAIGGGSEEILRDLASRQMGL
jgi:acyl-CoA dehydrogenase